MKLRIKGDLAVRVCKAIHEGHDTPESLSSVTGLSRYNLEKGCIPIRSAVGEIRTVGYYAKEPIAPAAGIRKRGRRPIRYVLSQYGRELLIEAGIIPAPQTAPSEAISEANANEVMTTNEVAESVAA